MAHPLTSGAAVLERAERFGRWDGGAHLVEAAPDTWIRPASSPRLPDARSFPR
jgi:hypothetical protein